MSRISTVEEMNSRRLDTEGNPRDSFDDVDNLVIQRNNLHAIATELEATNRELVEALEDVIKSWNEPQYMRESIDNAVKALTHPKEQD